MSKKTRPWNRRQRKAIRKRTDRTLARAASIRALRGHMELLVSLGRATRVEHDDGGVTYDLAMQPMAWRDSSSPTVPGFGWL